MQAQHQAAFFQTAQKFTCWIALREPNPLAERWFGRNGYRPKGPDCKARTADHPEHHWAGLVVNPLLVPEAFLPGSRNGAVEKWRKFLNGGRLPGGFACLAAGLERGLVRQKGLAIFADYDLMTLVKSDQKGAFLFTSNADELSLMAKVIPELNRLLGIEMIQHGPEFDPGFDGLGARARETILYFGPSHRFQTGISSMPEKGH